MRVVTAEEAVAGIRSGQQLYLQAASAVPSVLLDALVARASELEDVKIVHLHVEGAGPHPAPLAVRPPALGPRASELEDVKIVHLHVEGPGPHLAPEMAGHFRHRALFIGPNARAAVAEGRADYAPVFLSAAS